ncbi:MAG: cupin domain-containing protein [Gemmatimonadales bacterium]|nr:cupin domain-containing protein [Gemmatimonadales bacterium]
MDNKDLVGAAFAANELVDYQDGSVVSRLVLKQKSGSVTAFAFDRGEELSEHTVPHDALVHVTDGEAEISVLGAWHRVGSGQMIILPGGEPHAVKATTRFKMILVMLTA